MGLIDKASELASQAKDAVDAQRAQSDARKAAEAQQAQAYRQWLADQGRLFEYQVESIRGTGAEDKLDPARLERLLNEHAAQGWGVKAITNATLGSWVPGTSPSDGLIIVFERPLAQ